MNKLFIRQILIALLVMPFSAMAVGIDIQLDRAPDRSHDQAALQHGARVFTKYCLTCHSASFMRYNRLRDIGFTEQQIKDELMYATEKIGEPMKVVMRRADAQRWFGVVPPDHSVTVRARTSALGPGEDWIYTYLRSFYRDPMRPSGWNNLVFQNVAMHHVLWEFQGEQVLEGDPSGKTHKLKLVTPGKLSPAEYDNLVADLVAYLKYMSEPSAGPRKEVGIYVLIALFVLLAFAIVLKPGFIKLEKRP
ncbi:MAG: cytochrome c1 [Betaproteobacteria bacterium]|nr:cytochrome c1 [Betaproteobacteria bacterium]